MLTGDRMSFCCAQQRAAAESVLRKVQEQQEAWTRVDRILELSQSQQTKFFALQARASLRSFAGRDCAGQSTASNRMHACCPALAERLPCTCAVVAVEQGRISALEVDPLQYVSGMLPSVLRARALTRCQPSVCCTCPHADACSVLRTHVTQILEDVIKHRWGAIDDEQRAGIRNYISNLIIKISSDEATFRTERVFLNKLNIILVQVRRS